MFGFAVSVEVDGEEVSVRYGENESMSLVGNFDACGSRNGGS